MTEQEKKLLEGNNGKWFVIISKKTGTYYVDKNRTSYIFDGAEADSFCAAILDCRVEKQNIKLDRFLHDLHRHGADKIKVNVRGKDSFVTIDIQPQDLSELQHYVTDAGFAATRLKHTGYHSYLKDLLGEPLIAPLYIDKREEKEYPVLYYCYASYEGVDGRYHALFTDLKEFELWNNKQGKRYFPHQTFFRRFYPMTGFTHIVINPETENLILTAEIIAKENIDYDYKEDI